MDNDMAEQNTPETEGKIIMFKLSRGLSNEDKETVLHNVQTLSGIFAIAAVFPDAISEDKQNEYFATAKEDTNFDELVAEINDSSGIEHAWMPPQP